MRTYQATLLPIGKYLHYYFSWSKVSLFFLKSFFYKLPPLFSIYRALLNFKLRQKYLLFQMQSIPIIRDLISFLTFSLSSLPSFCRYAAVGHTQVCASYWPFCLLVIQIIGRRLKFCSQLDTAAAALLGMMRAAQCDKIRR